MKITNIVIENFMAIGKIEANLADKGLVLIQGENDDDSSQDSNGSGKSSFPDAISWCLFGTTARGETGDPVVNRTAKKNCKVSVELQEGSETFLVTRYRKDSINKNGLKLEINGRDATLGTNSLTQQSVSAILGCSAEVFNAAVYAGQEKMPDLPNMTDKNLKLIVEEAAGINRLKEAQEKTREALSEAKSELSKAENQVDMIEALIAEKKKAVKSLETHKEEWDETRIKKISELTDYVDDQQQILDQLEAEAASNSKELETELEEVNKEIKSYDKHEAKKESLTMTVYEAKKNFEVVEWDLERESLAAKKIMAEIKSIKDQVGSPCSECGKPYEEDDLHNVTANMKKKLLKQMAVVKDASSRSNTLKATLNEAELDLAEFEESLPDITDLRKRATEINNQLNAIKKDISDRETVRSLILKAKSDIYSLKTATNPHDKSINEFNHEIMKSVLDLKTANEERQKIEDEVNILNEVARVYGKAGVRAHILDTVTPFLNDRTNEYLTVLTDGNIKAVWSTLKRKSDGELAENFCIQVESRTGASTFKGLSGGERRKVRLSCAMALQDLVSSRATKPIELFIADEIDDALDESGLERLMNILDDKAKNKGTVLVISHNSLGDWIRQEVVIRKYKGQAEMVGECLIA